MRPDLSIHLAGLLKYAGLTGYAIRMYSVYNQSGDIERQRFGPTDVMFLSDVLVHFELLADAIADYTPKGVLSACEVLTIALERCLATDLPFEPRSCETFERNPTVPLADALALVKEIAAAVAFEVEGAPTRPVDLAPGQSPFDHLSREELIRQCSMLYEAASGLSSVANMVASDRDPYWTKGVGVSAQLRANEALEVAQNGFGVGELTGFYRNANGVLFTPTPKDPFCSVWSVCRTCHTMLGAPIGVDMQVEHDQLMGDRCKGKMERYTWEHLRNPHIDTENVDG